MLLLSGVRNLCGVGQRASCLACQSPLQVQRSDFLNGRNPAQHVAVVDVRQVATKLKAHQVIADELPIGQPNGDTQYVMVGVMDTPSMSQTLFAWLSNALA